MLFKKKTVELSHLQSAESLAGTRAESCRLGPQRPGIFPSAQEGTRGKYHQLMREEETGTPQTFQPRSKKTNEKREKRLNFKGVRKKGVNKKEKM